MKNYVSLEARQAINLILDSEQVAPSGYATLVDHPAVSPVDLLAKDTIVDVKGVSLDDLWEVAPPPLPKKMMEARVVSTLVRAPSLRRSFIQRAFRYFGL